MKENGGVGWNRQTQCLISPFSVLLFFILDLNVAKYRFSAGKGQKVWLIHLWRSRVNNLNCFALHR